MSVITLVGQLLILLPSRCYTTANGSLARNTMLFVSVATKKFEKRSSTLLWNITSDVTVHHHRCGQSRSCKPISSGQWVPAGPNFLPGISGFTTLRWSRAFPFIHVIVSKSYNSTVPYATYSDSYPTHSTMRSSTFQRSCYPSRYTPCNTPRHHSLVLVTVHKRSFPLYDAIFRLFEEHIHYNIRGQLSMLPSWSSTTASESDILKNNTAMLLGPPTSYDWYTHTNSRVHHHLQPWPYGNFHSHKQPLSRIFYCALFHITSTPTTRTTPPPTH